MADIDSEEEAFIENMLDISIRMAIQRLEAIGYPLEKIQAVKKTEHELRRMYQHLLQIKREDRKESDIKQAFLEYLERMGVLSETPEGEIRENVDNLCKMLLPHS